jgi:hypothetical protein
MGELGVVVKEGRLTFSPGIFNKDEFLKEPTTFYYVDVAGNSQEIALEKDSLGFTYCQVPVVYKLSDKEGLEVFYSNLPSKKFESLELDADTSQRLFERTDQVKQLVVSMRK